MLYISFVSDRTASKQSDLVDMQDIRDQKKTPPPPRNLTERFTYRLTDINLIIITYFPSQVYFKRTFAAKFEICYKYRS